MSSPHTLEIYDPPQEPLKIIHEDARLIVVSKPAGLLSVPGKGEHLADCLAARVQALYPEALVIHRLDMDTSGIFVMARDKDAQANIGKQFERRKTQKAYIADIWGVPENNEGLVDLPLRCDWENRPRQMVCYEHGKPSQTKWEVLETTSLRGGKADDAIQSGKKDAGLLRSARNDKDIQITRVKLEPITGRTHQLRVHMQALGHPILGDCFYAHEDARAAAPRLHLHAQSLTIHHPDDGQLVSFEDEVGF